MELHQNLWVTGGSYPVFRSEIWTKTSPSVNDPLLTRFSFCTLNKNEFYRSCLKIPGFSILKDRKTQTRSV